MDGSNPLDYLVSGDWWDSFLPDFVIAFAFFTALIYAVLGRRLGMQRPAVAVSAALGAALAVGLVWWEQANDLSIRDLGPVAVGFAVIVLAGVIYQSIRGIGGGWAGAGIALGTSILVGWAVGIDWPTDPQIVQTIAGVTLTVGILAFLIHRHGELGRLQPRIAEFKEIRHDMHDLENNGRVSEKLTRGFRRLRQAAGSLYEHPQDASDIMLQLRRMLPAEGWLTQRMAQLRAKAHFARNGHITRIEELRATFEKLPARVRGRAAKALTARYQELKLGERIERLDRLVASNERSVRELTEQAQYHLSRNDSGSLIKVLETAEKMQKRCTKLFRMIEQTEKRLLSAARSATENSPEVKHA